VTAPARGAVLVEPFSREATTAGAVVHGPVADGAVGPIVQSLAGDGVRRVLAWQPAALGLDTGWAALTAAGLEPVCPTLPADTAPRRDALAALDDIEVGLTGAVGALADTGTVVVASGPGRPRLAWLLPGRHIVFLHTRDLHATMADFFEANGRDVTAGAAHLAFVTGPSRTADIELTLTRGVHGPRELHVILIAAS
jgi:L-lactate dehydrogenase complex protein LldG